MTMHNARFITGKNGIPILIGGNEARNRLHILKYNILLALEEVIKPEHVPDSNLATCIMRQIIELNIEEPQGKLLIQKVVSRALILKHLFHTPFMEG